MPNAITIGSLSRALSEEDEAVISSGLSQVGAFLEEQAGLTPASVSSGALAIQRGEPSFRELKMLRRRDLMGESQGDDLNNPSVLVVRKVGGIGPVGDKLFAAANPEIFRGVSGNDINTLDGQVETSILLATDRFLLQQVNEPDQEKVGPVYTFAKPKVYCSGRQPRIYTYGGTLVDNYIDGSAKAFWWTIYDEYLRGSKCVQNGALVELYFRDQIRRGYLLHTNMTEMATAPSLTQFAFSMHVIAEGTSATWVPDVEVGIEEIVDRD